MIPPSSAGTPLAIAGFTFQISDNIPAHHAWLVEICQLFPAVHSARPVYTMTVRADASMSYSWEDYLVAAPPPTTAPGSFRIHGYDFCAERKDCAAPIEVVAHPESAPAGILRCLVSIALVEQGGLLLHAASFATAGRGVACPAPSESGKSTLAKLIRSQVTLFTDEVTALRFVGDLPVISTTPFSGELGVVSGPASAPLEALLFLRHAPEMRARPLEPAGIAGRLAGCLFMPLNHRRWAEAMLATAERVARAVPGYDLGFRPEPAVWETIQEVMHETVPAA